MPTYNQRDKTRSAMSPPPQGDNYQAILQLQAAIRRLETDLETANRKLSETTSLANQHKRQLRGMNFVDSPTIHWDQSAGAIRAHGAAKTKRSVTEAADGTSAWPAKMVSATSWQVDIYADGFDSDATERLYLDTICNLTAGQYLPIGHELIVIAAGDEYIGLTTGVF